MFWDAMYNNPRHQLWTIWYDMIGRCHKRTHKAYKNYGGRGITVCHAWYDFETFARDMGPFPGKGYTMERVKNHLGYSRANVVWATYKVNNRNRRGCLPARVVTEIKRLHHKGQWPRGSAAAYAKQYGVNPATISHIIRGATWT